MKVRIYVPAKVVSEPLVAKLVLEKKVLINILKANVDEHGGDLIVELPPEKANEIIKAFRAKGVSVSALEKPIILDDQKCINCSACISICPLKVFSLKEDGSLLIDYEKCVQCGLCIPACPVQALGLPKKA